MRLLIDNLDGLGAVDYTDQLSPEAPFEIARKLNAPSTCSCQLLSGPVAAPRRLGRVVVSRTRDGLVLFTGYVTTEPETVYAGESSSMSVYRVMVAAESDDWLLDKQGLMTGAASFGLTGAALLTSLTKRVDAQRFTTATTGLMLSTGMARLDSTRLWSENAGAIAGAVYARYRVLAGQVQLQPMGATTHTMTVAKGSLHQNGLELRHARTLVNDVTISGPMEAGAYVTEIFSGDGTTAVFQLSGAPFRGRSGASANLVSDAFPGATVNSQVWALSDPGAHLSPGATGLQMSGGDGLDGETTLAAIDDVELAGGLVLEAANVSLNQGSDGVLLGLYNGPVKRANCVAGFDVRQLNGTTTVGPLVNGAVAGTLLTLVSGHTYVLRLRVYCSAMERQQQSYHVMVDGATGTFGGGLITAPMSVVFEVRDTGASSNTPVTVLYDGGMASSPGSVSWAPVNSVQLKGAVGSLKMTATGSAWVRDTTSGGVTSTKLLGPAGEGGDATMSAGGELRFFPGRVPAAGDRVTVTYRAARRAVARLVNAASVATEAVGGLPGTAAWRGGVLEPAARSTEDCANAAAAVLAMGVSRTASLAGSYTAVSGVDVWPGDALLLSGVPSAAQVLARKVTLRSHGGRPEMIESVVEFANDWASSPSIRLSGTLAADVPSGLAALLSATASVSDLAGLTVSSVTTTAVQVDAGTAPPANGGFEVRRRDGAFGPGTDADLVLRSPVRGFTLPRSAMTERFYVRMYDGSTPPVYSWRSSVISTDVPMS